MTIDLNNPNNQILLTLFFGSIIALFTVLGFWIVKLLKKTELLALEARNDIGKPMRLQDVRNKLPRENLNRFLIRYFIPIEETITGMKKGLVLISHPNRLDLVYYVEAFFQTDEEILPDSKTVYKIKTSMLVSEYDHFLTKV